MNDMNEMGVPKAPSKQDIIVMNAQGDKCNEGHYSNFCLHFHIFIIRTNDEMSTIL